MPPDLLKRMGERGHDSPAAGNRRATRPQRTQRTGPPPEKRGGRTAAEQGGCGRRVGGDGSAVTGDRDGRDFDERR